MDNLETLLFDAREKRAAEEAAAELRASLAAVDAQIVELTAERNSMTQQIEKSSGITRAFRRKRVDPETAGNEIARLDLMLGALTNQQENEQLRLREQTEAAHGAELAYAQLGVEMRKRTAALSPDDPAHARLTALNVERDLLVERRKLAQTVSSLATELLPLVGGAEKADDGTDRLYVEVQSASLQAEKWQELLPQNALIARAILKDRLEAFRGLAGPTAQYRSLTKIAELVLSDVAVDHESWLGEVRAALNSALEHAGSEQEETRQQLVVLDRERVELLSV